MTYDAIVIYIKLSKRIQNLYYIFKNFKIQILGAILKIYLLVFIKILLVY